MRPYGEVLISPYDVPHCEKDLQQLVGQIHRLNDEVRVVMESTGAYHFPILTYLKQHDIFVSVVNAYLMKKRNSCFPASSRSAASFSLTSFIESPSLDNIVIK